jgi:hypothetical protein
LPIANGGTGQTTASAGFNALSPITTTGDLIIGNGTNSATRLAIGANTYVLTSNGTTASWQASSGGGSGTVNSGTQYQLGYYASTGTGISGNPNIKTDANSNLNLAATNATLNSANTFGFKNRIINGGAVIDQRNAGASVTNAAAYPVYTLDRWSYGATQASKFTVQQNAGSVTPPIGFINYLGVTSSSAYSVTSSDYFLIEQSIEGLNAIDLGWGSANAKTITLSFQVYSSLTGTFGGSLRNSASNRSYPFTYTISSANTWTTISLTIAGDTTGTWLTTNGIFTRIEFGLGVGSTYSGTSGAWAAGNYLSATGATSVVGTNGATFYITGVQLEVGTQATSFDFRDYGRELILCQRYYELMSGLAGGYNIFVGQAISGSDVQSGGIFKVSKRASPSASSYGTINANGYNNGGAGAVTISNGGFSTETWGIRWTGASGLTAGNASAIYPSNVSSGIAFSAEL